ncbi:hypothetical protein CALVIDRAFT_565093 [Calocera viscosa TUFC12733]|uniref:Uncharacterized protein n=1 Tax=Calocera viscosa (strain TUFC12733) TaxID=1330018 RepID=A0A167KT43_CALVF|nr:hypothetical protein CALVIDRAFT_565093 [Calocera viscosa TUFC12733]
MGKRHRARSGKKTAGSGRGVRDALVSDSGGSPENSPNVLPGRAADLKTDLREFSPQSVTTPLGDLNEADEGTSGSDDRSVQCDLTDVDENFLRDELGLLVDVLIDRAEVSVRREALALREWEEAESNGANGIPRPVTILDRLWALMDHSETRELSIGGEGFVGQEGRNEGGRRATDRTVCELGVCGP